jgi:hypothetical protein
MASPSSSTDKTTILATDPETVTPLEKFLGGTVFFLFVNIWLSSLSSPVLFVLAIRLGHYVSAIVIVLLSILAYTPWKKGGTIQTAFHRYVKYYGPRWFQRFSIVIEDQDEETKNHPQTLYAVHPHGAFCIGWSMLFAHDYFAKTRFCFAPALYYSPFFRLFSRSTGNPGSAAKASMVSYMKQGQDIALPPGGFEEATLTSLEHDRVFISKRTGFVRLCLQHGIAIRPVYVFGEKSLYWNVQGGWKTRLALNKFGLPTILPFGYPWIPLVPKNTASLTICIGSPLVLPRLENPTKEQVAHWHAKYVAALTRLFEDNKETAYVSEVAKTAKMQVW